jgi:hypothetical protein
MSRGSRTRLVQLIHPEEGRRAGLIEDGELHLLATYRSIYDFALAAIETGWKLRDLLSTDLSGIVLDYREVHSLKTPWRFLPAFDHPSEPGRCLVSALESEAGKTVWRYQGSGECLRGHGEPLPISNPSGLFPEIAAAYVIGESGVPRRLGLAGGIRSPRQCALGPELIADAKDDCLEGWARLSRQSEQVWSHELRSGTVSFTSALAAVEARHFENADHARRGDTHVIFFAAKLFGPTSFPDILRGDEAIVQLGELGQPLQAMATRATPVTPQAVAVPL